MAAPAVLVVPAAAEELVGGVRLVPPARLRILTAPMAVRAVRAVRVASAVAVARAVLSEVWDWKARRALMATAVSGAPVAAVAWVVGERMDSTAVLETIRVRPAPTAGSVVRVVRAALAVPAVSVASPADRRGLLAATVSGVPAVPVAMPVQVARVVTVVPVRTALLIDVTDRPVALAEKRVAGAPAVPVEPAAAALSLGPAGSAGPVAQVAVAVWAPTVAPATTRPWMAMEPAVVMPGTAVRAGPAVPVARRAKPAG